MNSRKIKGTNLKTSLIGFGTWGLAGNAYGNISKKKSLYLLDYAFERGINFFDTSSLYGNGYVEEILGEAFISNNKKNNTIIATKFGMIPNKDNLFIPKFNFSKNFLQKKIYESIRRIKKDSIDILQLHSPKFSFIKSERFNEIIYLLKKNQELGNIKHYGISVQTPLEAKYILEKNFKFKLIQLNFNLLDMRAYDLGIFALAKKKSISIVSRTPLGMGFLSGKRITLKKQNDHRKRFNSDRVKLWLKVARKLNRKFDKYIPLPALALKFSTYEKTICSTIPGMMNEADIDNNIKSLDYDFSISKNLKIIQSIYNEYLT